MQVARAYSVLGVGRGASLHEVRSAYRTQLLRNHPDGGGSGDPATLAEIRSAYRAVVERGVAKDVRVERPRHLVDLYA
jgi:DnaJ-class molecular chaperone